MKKINRLVMVVVVLSLLAVPVLAEEAAVKELDISKMTCKQLMAGDDTDREVGIAFFHGFFAGKKNHVKVDLPAASALTDHVKDYCLSNPASTVMDAFTKSAK